jgi:hypothetical protein
MSEEVILDITTIEETVTIDTTDPEVIEIKVVAVTGGASEWNQLEGTADKVPFTTTNGGPQALGELAWLASTESLALRLKNGENLDLGEETIYHVDNNTGSTIAKGAAVSYAGTAGASGKLRVKPWNGSTDLPEAFMGLAMGAIATGQTGYVTAFGVIRGVNTSEFSDGVILYANPAGTGLTSTKPTGTHVVAAVCINAGNNGTILVRPTIGGYVETTDPRLSDARTPLAHTHGNISNGGAIGTTADLAVVTGTGGALTVTSRSGIDSRTSFPNADVTAATTNATPNTLVRRNEFGDATFGGIAGDVLDVREAYISETYWVGNVFNYSGGAAGSGAIAHRTALGLTSLATTTAGTGVTTALAINVGSSGAFVVNGGALGTPSSGTLTNATGLPISTGVAGLGSGVATFLATPTSANLAAAVTDETGSGSLVLANSPTITSPSIAGTAQFTGTARPTSAAVGSPAATDLITRADADARIIDLNWRAIPLSLPGAPIGCVVVDSTNTASAINILNYTNTTYPLTILSCAGDARNIMNFDRRHRISFDLFVSNASGAGEGWIVFGEAFNKTTVVDPDKKSFGLKITSSGVALWVHNGTTLTVSTAISIPLLETLYFVTLEYWNGVLNGTINGTSLATATNGPTGQGVANATAISFQAKTGATNERCRFGVMYPKSLTTPS